MDDKGSTLLAVFGLPPLAHEDDAARGVLSALAICARLHILGFVPSIGLFYSFIICVCPINFLCFRVLFYRALSDSFFCLITLPKHSFIQNGLTRVIDRLLENNVFLFVDHLAFFPRLLANFVIP